MPMLCLVLLQAVFILGRLLQNVLLVETIFILSRFVETVFLVKAIVVLSFGQNVQTAVCLTLHLWRLDYFSNGGCVCLSA